MLETIWLNPERASKIFPNIGTTKFNKYKDEFIKLWEAHSQKVINYKNVLLIKDYAKTFPFQPTDEKSSTQRETLPFTFDAMGELWYESKDDFIKARNTPEGQKALADLRVDELKFVDMANSVMWLGTEERIFDKLPF